MSIIIPANQLTAVPVPAATLDRKRRQQVTVASGYFHTSHVPVRAYTRHLTSRRSAIFQHALLDASRGHFPATFIPSPLQRELHSFKRRSNLKMTKQKGRHFKSKKKKGKSASQLRRERETRIFLNVLDSWLDLIISKPNNLVNSCYLLQRK